MKLFTLATLLVSTVVSLAAPARADNSSPSLHIEGDNYLNLDFANDGALVTVKVDGPQLYQAIGAGVGIVTFTFPASACRSRADDAFVLSCETTSFSAQATSFAGQPAAFDFGALHWLSVNIWKQSIVTVDSTEPSLSRDFNVDISADNLPGIIANLSAQGLPTN